MVSRRLRVADTRRVIVYNWPVDRRIYLDNSATTPILPEVLDCMCQCYRQLTGNPASQHSSGRDARRQLEDARDQVGQVLGARRSASPPDRVYFTSGGTEANNLAIFGLAGSPPGHLVTSAIEHPSVAEAAHVLSRRGWDVDLLGVDRDGVVLAGALPGLLREDSRLVSVMLANNETGAVQPVAEIAAACRQRGVPVHTDAVQAAGSMGVDLHALHVDLVSCSAHKIHGPPGVGALVVRGGLTPAAQLVGGSQQLAVRPGTESVALCVAMARALKLWHDQRERIARHVTAMRDRFEASLRQVGLAIEVHSCRTQRLPHVSFVSFRGLDRQQLLMTLDMAGVSCSSGTACASGSSRPSSVLRAMNCSESSIRSAIRFSFSRLTGPPEVDESVRRISKVCKQLSADNSAGKSPVTPPAVPHSPV